MKNSLQTVQQTIDAFHLLERGEKVLVAFSGGYDSVCLALCLKELGFSIGLAHVHHGLRETADRDADFCKAFAERLDVPFHFCKTDVKAIADAKKISTETAGRNVRYTFFESIEGYDKIATGHHKNDCAETVLQHLIRGTGLKGLTGISAKRDKIIRPLIGLTRAEIESYVNEKGIVPCADETNQRTDYARNRIRLEMIPLLQKENGNAVENICRTASLLEQDEDFLTQTARKYVSDNQIEISVLKTLHPAIAGRALRLAYAHTAGTAKDFEQKHISYILSHLKEHGDILNLCFSVTCKAQYGKLLFVKNTDEAVVYCYEIQPDSAIDIPETGRRFRLTVSESAPLSEHYFDLNALGDQKLFLRSPNADDRFFPFGMNGSKRLSKLLIDLKIPENKRKQLPLFATDREILCIPGFKRSRFYPTDTQTKKYLNLLEEPAHEQFD
ncbi:MAG: tRNA lysidine(34) synthetase TilS [Clostridia bacterium]|nr:tRNA lysidine(34) synthetase TilS [Clostridia bacterium]